MAQQEGIEQLRPKLTALATEVASMRGLIGRSPEISPNHPPAMGRG